MKLNCNDCSKTFKSKLALKYHKRKHDKPHVCGICKCRFTSKDAAETHAEKHTVYHENNKILENENVSWKSEICYNEMGESPHFTRKEDKIDDKDSFTVCSYREKGNSNSEEQTVCIVRNSKKFESKSNCKFLAEEVRNSALTVSANHNEEGQANSTSRTSVTGFTKVNTVKQSTKSIDRHDKLLLDINPNKCEDHISGKNTFKKGSNIGKYTYSPEMIKRPGINNETNETGTRAYTLEQTKRPVIQNETNETEGKNDIEKQCKICQKTYKNIKTFTRHSCKPKEDIIKKKTCDICEKSFKTNEHFRQHVRSHTGEKPFLCISCGKSFSQQGNLIKHMRIHAGTRMFLCEICSRPFMTKGALHEHIRVHSDDKGFQCDICKKYFRHKHGLDNHQRKRKYPCNVRKYGENKGSKKRRKVKRIDSSTENEKTQAHLAYTSVATLTEAFEGSNVTCIQDNYVQASPDQAPEYIPDSYTPNKSNEGMKSFIYSNIFSIEHSVQRLQNFTEVMLPRLQSVNSVQTYNRGHTESGNTDEQTNRYKEVPNSNLTTGGEVHHTSTRNSDIPTESYQRHASDEKLNRTHIEKILMQYYNNEINPMYFDKNSNDVVNGSDFRTCIIEMNTPSLNTPDPLLNTPDVKESLADKKSQENIEKYTNDYSEDSVYSVPASYQAQLPTLSDCLPSLHECNRGKNAEELIPKRTEQLKTNDLSEGNLELAQETAKDDSSELDNEDIDTHVTDLPDPQNKRNTEYGTDSSSVPFYGSDCNTDNVCANEENSMIQGNDEPFNVHTENDSVAKSIRHKPPVEFTEEEVREIIEKARRKDFKCGNCDKNFSNEYCLNVHNCKTKTFEASESKRKLCQLCKRSYANKYLLAYHSCRPNKSEKWNKISERDRKIKKDCIQNTETAKEKRASRTKRRSSRMKKSERKSNEKLRAQTGLRNRNSKTGEKVVKEREISDISDSKTQRSKTKNNSDQEIKINNYVDQELSVTDNKSAKTVEKMICEVCGKTYKNKSNLNNHSCKPPLKESKTCKICGKVFNLKVHLQIHLRIHTGELPFLCKICGKQFNQGANLMKHLRIHNPEKLFSCEICDRRFTQKGALTEHRIVHTKFKPYVCFKCDKSFRHKHGLQNHMNRKFPCDSKKKAKVKVRKSKVVLKQKRGQGCVKQKADDFSEVKVKEVEENTIQNHPPKADLLITEHHIGNDHLVSATNHQTQPVRIGRYTSEHQQIIHKLERPDSHHSDQVVIQVNVTESGSDNERYELLVKQPQDRWALTNERPGIFVTESLTYKIFKMEYPECILNSKE